MPTTHLGAWPDTPERYSEVSYDLSASTAPPPVIIGGDGVSRDEVVAVARGRAKAEISAEATANMERARALVNRAGSSPDPVYGVSTGFGLLATTRIPPERRSDLQHALIRSHAAGMGDPVEVEVVRAMMLLRARTLCMGFSGSRPAVAAGLVDL
ncbi:MAG TPA: aromatic amino acid lyase, partial [Candidatus Dormibacteraeota bacterium]|nr:aromatic amino acid lyase [Candidatus Dormibacteraeota bacterium]